MTKNHILYMQYSKTIAITDLEMAKKVLLQVMFLAYVPCYRANDVFVGTLNTFREIKAEMYP